MATRPAAGGAGAGRGRGRLEVWETGTLWRVPSCLIGDTVTNIDTKDRLVMQCPLQSHLLLPALCRQKDLSEGMNTLHLPFHPVSVF